MRTKRLEEIAEYINRNDMVPFSYLCERFHTSSATMRRDLKYLEEMNRIKRVHGGALSVKSKHTLFEAPYHNRLTQNVSEKRRITEYAMALISDNDVVMLDSSTTNCELAHLLAKSNLKIMVITNDIYIGCILEEHPSIELLVIGGLIRPTFYSTMGVFAENMLSQLHADKVFMGCDALHPEQGALIFHLDEINCKRLMIERSKECIMLCDHTKFNESAVLPVCPINKISKIVTGNELDDATLLTYAQHRHLNIIRA